MLLANGCSFTEGYYLDNLKDAWPFQLGVDAVNLAQGGASNQRIFRTTIDYLSINRPDYVAIGWTEPSRYELPLVNGTWARILSHDVLFHERLTSNPDAKQLHDYYYKHLHNDFITTVDLLNYIITIQRLCKLQNIPYVFFYAFVRPNFGDVLKDYYEYYRYEQHQLDEKLVIANKILQDKISQIDQTRFMPSTMKDWCKQHRFDFEPDGHPLSAGHRVWATEIANKMFDIK
jgi:hypothetical protein